METDRDRWETPQELFDIMKANYDMTFDCCASGENSKCITWAFDFESYDPEDLYGVCCWMNPPFSQAERMFKHFFHAVEKGVAIYRCDNMETKVWREIIFPNASWIWIPPYRVCYKGIDSNWDRPVFGSALIGYNVPVPSDVKGTVIKLREE